jgi:hypothetical protein
MSTPRGTGWVTNPDSVADQLADWDPEIDHDPAYVCNPLVQGETRHG